MLFKNGELLSLFTGACCNNRTNSKMINDIDKIESKLIKTKDIKFFKKGIQFNNKSIVPFFEFGDILIVLKNVEKIVFERFERRLR